MPTPTERLEAAEAILALDLPGADAAAIHSAYYACAHHCATVLKLRLERPNAITHKDLKGKVEIAALDPDQNRSTWRGFGTLQELRNRADYRSNPPTHEDAAMAVMIAAAILAVP